MRREKLMELIATLPTCLIGMEECGGAHQWAQIENFQFHDTRHV